MTAPLPPLNFDKRTPNLVVVTQNTVLYRFYTAAFAPIFFDKSTGGRLNSPNASYGVLYAARSMSGAFAETFLRQPGRQSIAIDLINRKGLVNMVATRALTFCALTGPGLAKLGATAEVTHSGLPYDCPQLWSKEIHAHSSGVDGIVYKARHDDAEDCFAIFDRAASGLAEQSRITNLDVSWFWDIAAIYDVGIAP